MRIKALGATSFFLITNVAAVICGIACSAPPPAAETDDPPPKKDGGRAPQTASTTTSTTSPGSGSTPDGGVATGPGAGTGAAKGAECKLKTSPVDACLTCCDEAFPNAFQAGTAKFVGLVCGTCQAQCASSLCANPRIDEADQACDACIEPHAEEWIKAAQDADAKDLETANANACLNQCPGNEPGGGGGGEDGGGIEEDDVPE
jgi:hypothetical protein